MPHPGSAIGLHQLFNYLYCYCLVVYLYTYDGCCYTSPEVQKYLHKMEEERKRATLNKDQDNRSFIQKYVSNVYRHVISMLEMSYIRGHGGLGFSSQNITSFTIQLYLHGALAVFVRYRSAFSMTCYENLSNKFSTD